MLVNVVVALANVLARYDKDLGVSGKHKKAKHIVLQQLIEAAVFAHVYNRKHICFPNIVRNLLSTIDLKKLDKWMTEQFQCLHDKFFHH